MTSKIKIKMGAIEIEYEGSEDFLKEELPELLKAVSDLYRESAPSLKSDNGSDVDGIGSKVDVVGTTGSLAAKLGGNSGPDLVMAAASRLTFVLDKDKFSRKELLDEIKSATAYFKTSYSGNLTKILNALVKDDKLMEPAKETYSLSADSRKSIGAKLA